MENPLVTVIVLCFNHEKFIKEAIESIVAQNYNNIEIIVADDASTDNSPIIIEKLNQQYKFKTSYNSQNLGNCKTFNKAFHCSKGAYVIDLAADDALLPDRIIKGIEAFKHLENDYGVHFCDVAYIDAMGNQLGTQYKRNPQNLLVENVPEGWIYKELLERYVISPPSMMIKRAVLDSLGGYDETLSYEDFDFWIRSARKYKYAFSDEILVKKRILKNSLSEQQKSFRNRHLKSTAKVCEKAFHLCKSPEEYQALKKRINYELKWALWTGNVKIAVQYIKLLKKVKL